MTKYNRFVFIFICACIFNFTSVEAAGKSCPSGIKKELAQIASRIKVNYEIKDFSEEKKLSVDGKETTYKIPNYVFEISIYNMSDDIYVVVDKTNKQMLSGTNAFTVRNSDAIDGIYTFTDDNFGEIYNYNVTVYSNDKECSNVALRTYKFTKPRYNAYSEFTYCQNSSNFYCQRFIGTEINIKDTDDFLAKIKVNNEKNDPDRDKKDETKIVTELFKNNWKTYILIFLIVVALATGVIFFIKKRRKKEGWEL